MNIGTWLIIGIIIIAFITLWVFQGMKRRQAAIDSVETTETLPENNDSVEEELNYSFDGVLGAERFGPSVLAAGATIEHAGHAYMVSGSAALRDGDRIWYEHLLQGEGVGRYWLGVDNVDGRLRLSWWQIREDLPTEPVAELKIASQLFQEYRSGNADFAVSGLSGAVTQGTYAYRDFSETQGDGLLRIETWGENGTPETSIGHYIDSGELQVISPSQD